MAIEIIVIAKTTPPDQSDVSIIAKMAVIMKTMIIIQMQTTIRFVRLPLKAQNHNAFIRFYVTASKAYPKWKTKFNPFSSTLGS